MVTILWIIAALLCVALCAYGITTAVRRSKDPRWAGHPRTDAALGIASLGRSRRVSGHGGS